MFPAAPTLFAKNAKGWGTRQYYVEDMLGSSRVVTQNTGTVCYDADFTPFGGEKTATNTCTQNVYKFEGKERDAETQNDDFGARYYTWRFGRWLSADWSAVPAAVPYANLTNPQTLNLYAMVADDPESFADLDGHLGLMNQFNLEENHGCGITGELCNYLGGDEYRQDATNQLIAQLNEQKAAQQQDKSPNATVTTNTYKATADGLTIILVGTETGGDYTGLNWVQTVTTNDPKPGKPADQPYADTDPGQKTPFYLNPKEQAEYGKMTANGGTSVFSDSPERGFSGKPISWHANLSFVGIKKDGTFDRLKSFTYGFTLDAKGVHLDPLRPTQ